MAVRKEVTPETTGAVTKPAVAKTPAAKTYQPSDMIMCRSVTHGELIFLGRKSGLQYSWSNIGDETPVEYQDLQAAYSIKSRFLTDPLFVIEDDALVKKWGNMLQSVYDGLDSGDAEQLLQLPPDALRKALTTASNGMRKSVMSLAAEKIINNELDSLSRIRVIDDVLGTELIKMIAL